MTNEEAKEIQARLEQVSDVCYTLGIVRRDRANDLIKAARMHGGEHAEKVVELLKQRGYAISPLFWHELVNEK